MRHGAGVAGGESPADGAALGIALGFQRTYPARQRLQVAHRPVCAAVLIANSARIQPAAIVRRGLELDALPQLVRLGARGRLTKAPRRRRLAYSQTT